MDYKELKDGFRDLHTRAKRLLAEVQKRNEKKVDQKMTSISTQLLDEQQARAIDESQRLIKMHKKNKELRDKSNRKDSLDAVNELFELDGNLYDENVDSKAPLNYSKSNYDSFHDSSGKKQNYLPPHDIYNKVTNSIIRTIRMIEDGDGDLQLPWHQLGFPRNIKTGRYKSAINIILLWFYANTQKFSSSTWGTEKQWKDMGYKLKEGEKECPSSIVGFNKIPNPHVDISVFKHTNKDNLKKQESKQEDRQNSEFIFYPSHLNAMYNADQIEGFNHEEPVQVTDLGHVKSFIDRTCAKIVHWGDGAYYKPVEDTIFMPDPKRFKSTDTSNPTENYYSILFHELIHWTGVPDRCNREIFSESGENNRAFEELVAELGAAFLCSKLNVSNNPRPEHADYIKSWLKKLENDDRFIFRAATKAQEACEYLLNLSKIQ